MTDDSSTSRPKNQAAAAGDVLTLDAIDWTRPANSNREARLRGKLLEQAAAGCPETFDECFYMAAIAFEDLGIRNLSWPGHPANMDLVAPDVREAWGRTCDAVQKSKLQKALAKKQKMLADAMRALDEPPALRLIRGGRRA